MHAAGQPRLDSSPAGGSVLRAPYHAGSNRSSADSGGASAIEIGDERPRGGLWRGMPRSSHDRPAIVGDRRVAVDRVSELDERILALAADHPAKAVREQLVRDDRRVRPAGDQRQPGERARQRVGRLHVQRLDVQADEVGPNAAIARAISA